MIQRFAAWRYAAAMTAFHEHPEECRVCEFELPCRKMARINARRDYWRKRDFVAQIVHGNLWRWTR